MTVLRHPGFAGRIQDLHRVYLVRIFSLAQHWYAGGIGPKLQTVEVGWQVYPQKYGNANPALFIYWTADDYTTTGCYNLDCHAFVQTSPHWTFGGAISPVSTIGGTQYELEVFFLLYENNWWLYLKGTDASSAVGYFPTSLFNGGQLATNATDIDYGGETVRARTGRQWGAVTLRARDGRRLHTRGIFTIFRPAVDRKPQT